jgi:hypothetical protein
MSSWLSRYIQPSPPPGSRPAAVRTPVHGLTCPRCGSTDAARYGVATAWGARMAVKCQRCLYAYSLERPRAEDPWPPFRSVAFDWEASLAERASRAELDRNPTP